MQCTAITPWIRQVHGMYRISRDQILMSTERRGVWFAEQHGCHGQNSGGEP